MSVTHLQFLQSFEVAPANLLLRSQGGGFFVMDELWAAPVREHSYFPALGSQPGQLPWGIACVHSAERQYDHLDNLICS